MHSLLSMNLELYYREECPFSQKVLKYIEEKDLNEKIDFHEVDEDLASLEKLEALTDDDQVPCLVVDGKPVLESDDIIEFLSMNSV